MKTYQWLLLLFAAVSLVSAFVAMEEGPMPIVFILMALIASTCAQSIHVIHERIDRIERKNDESPEWRCDQELSAKYGDAVRKTQGRIG